MINYFFVDSDENINGGGTAQDESNIVVPEGHTCVLGTVPEGKNAYSGGYFYTKEPSAEQLATEALVKRLKLLSASDWTQLPDVIVYNRPDWADYRQKLRDITNQPNWPFNIVWPTKPE